MMMTVSYQHSYAPLWDFVHSMFHDSEQFLLQPLKQVVLWTLWMVSLQHSSARLLLPLPTLLLPGWMKTVFSYLLVRPSTLLVCVCVHIQTSKAEGLAWQTTCLHVHKCIITFNVSKSKVMSLVMKHTPDLDTQLTRQEDKTMKLLIESHLFWMWHHFLFLPIFVVHLLALAELEIL